jgi:endonuclease YncB( thermonuclease family)
MRCNMAGHDLGREMGDVSAIISRVDSTSYASWMVGHGWYWKFNGCAVLHPKDRHRRELREGACGCWQRRSSTANRLVPAFFSLTLNRSARSTETLINIGIVIESLLHAQYSQLYELLKEQVYLVNRG